MHVQLLGSFKTTVTVLELEESGSPHWICICFLFNEEKRFISKLGQTVGQPASYNVQNDDIETSRKMNTVTIMTHHDHDVQDSTYVYI